MHVVCAWIGNSQPVAAKHYLQVTDEHFTLALQNALQHPSADPRTDSHRNRTNVAEGIENGDMRSDATPCEARVYGNLGDTGLEPVTSRV